jgi:RNase H-fold protein (predicted Holliday junction resolvase)
VNILAIDPGSQKCGMAVVDDESHVLAKMVISVEELGQTVLRLHQQFSITRIVLGDRTRSKSFKASLKQFNLPITLVDENRSSIEGRIRYLKENTHGLKKLLPIGLRVPDRPFDDYVAVILAERYLKKKPSE